jgi:adenylyltransferase/sulfurtransferase
MALSDEQIDRYSRQIIVPGIGGRGQERLLAARVLIAGEDDVARTAALYLAGAGVGRIDLLAPRTWANSLAADLADLNPGVRVEVVDRADRSACSPYGAILASSSDVDSLKAIARAASGRWLITAVSSHESGWMTVNAPEAVSPCPACAATEMAARRVPREAVGAPTAALLGSLAAIAMLRALLAFGDGARVAWWQYDVERATLEERPAVGRPDCEYCRESGPA